MSSDKNPVESPLVAYAVDAWNAKCDKAERALDKAVKRWNDAPDDATQEQLNALSKAMSVAQVEIQTLYMNLPYSLDDVAGEFYAQLRVAEMVEAGEVTPRKRKRITSEQVAEVVNRYLSNRHALVVADYEKRFNRHEWEFRHEWEIQETVGYDISEEDVPEEDRPDGYIPDEHIPAHNDIHGMIWVEPLTEEGEETGWRMGYGLAKDELRLGNKFRLATEFRGAWRALEKEFGLSKKWEEFVPETKVEPDIPKPTATRRKYGPSRYTDERKIDAVVKWHDLDKGIRAVTLEEFLDAEFGNERGVNNVSKSAFYGWRKKFRQYLGGKGVNT